MFKLDLEKAGKPEIKLPTSLLDYRQSKGIKKKYISASLTMLKPFDCMDHDKLWKVLQEMGIPDLLTYLLRNLYAGQKATVRTGHGTTDWLQRGKKMALLSGKMLLSARLTEEEHPGQKSDHKPGR